MKSTTLYLLATLILSLPAAARNTNDNLQHSPLYFIENKGQVTDKNHRPAYHIHYKLEAPGLNAFIGNGLIKYQFSKANAVHYLEMNLVNANTAAEIIPGEEQEYRENYYLPYCYGQTAKTYKKITYRNIYPNIDWVVYSNNNELEYDFVVHKGGNVKDIRLKYTGAASLQLKDGAVTASTAFGTIKEHALYTYDANTKQKIASSFKLKNNTLSFSVPKHDGDIVIDPFLAWSTYYGDSLADFANAITNAGSSYYIVGSTNNNKNIATTGLYQDTLTGGADAYILKLGLQGQRLWATYYGGLSTDAFTSVTLDMSGNIYAAGNTFSANIATSGVQQPLIGGGQDALLVKFNSSGMMQWATYYGGIGTETNNAIACDNANNIYIAGSTTTTLAGIIATTGSLQPTLASGTAGFIAKFNSSGARMWGSYYGTNTTAINALKCDLSGNIYFGGSTNSTNAGLIATPGTQQPTFGTGINTDGFLVKIDSSGSSTSKKWGTYLGSTGSDVIRAIILTNTGSIFAVGSATSVDSIATIGSFKPAYSGGTDGFIAKYNDSGKFAWSTYYGGSASDVITGITYAGNGLIYIAGTTFSTSGIAMEGGRQTSIGGSGDGFLATLDTNGRRYYASYHGGSASDAINGITNDGLLVLFAGTTSSSTGIGYHGYKDTLTGVQSDALIAGYTLDAVTINQPFNDTLLCPGDTVHLAYTVRDNNLGTGNSFTVFLSDSLGSFTSAKIIGSVNSTTSGTINAIIPFDTDSGSNYRLRIVSTSRPDTSGVIINPIHIKQGPHKPVATVTAPICEGGAAHIAASAFTGSAYQWSGPNGFSSTLSSFNYSNSEFKDSGNYIVTATYNGCTAKDTVTLVVYHKSTIVHPTNNGPVCVGDTLRLFSSAHNIPGISYAWTGPSFADTARNPKMNHATLAMAGVYKATATFVNTSMVCGTDSTIVVVNPFPADVAASSNSPITEGMTLELQATSSSSNVTWSWTGPVGFTATTQNPTRSNTIPSMAGAYIVKATLNSCSTYDTTLVTISEQNKKEFNLYPNPSRGVSITLEGEALSNDQIPFIIVDIRGKTVYSDIIEPVVNKFKKTIQLSNLADGDYRVRMRMNNTTKVYTFVIKR